MKQRYLTMQYRSESGKTVCLCADQTEEYDSRKPVQILDDMCCMLGAGIKGRIESAAKLLHIVKKVPVLVSEDTGLMYFPVTSPVNDPECLWICYSEVMDYRSYGNDKTEIVFTKGISVIVNASRRSIKMQMDRCHSYIMNLQRNKENFFNNL